MTRTVPRFNRNDRFERWWDTPKAEGLLDTEIADFEKAILAWDTKTPQREAWGVSLSEDSWRALLWQARYLTNTTPEKREKDRAESEAEAKTGVPLGKYVLPASMVTVTHGGSVIGVPTEPLDLSVFLAGGPGSVEAQQQRMGT